MLESDVFGFPLPYFSKESNSDRNVTHGKTIAMMPRTKGNDDHEDADNNNEKDADDNEGDDDINGTGG